MPIYHQMLGKLPTNTDRIRNYLADEDLGAKQCSAHENVLKPGAEVPSHLHGVEEIIVCLEGVGECSFPNQPPARYYAGSVVIIPPSHPMYFGTPVIPYFARYASLQATRRTQNGSNLRAASPILAATFLPNCANLCRGISRSEATV